MDAFVTVVSAVAAAAFSVAVEAVPGLDKWWESLSAEWKKATRAYIGLGVVVALALLQYVGGANYGLPVPFDVHAVLWLIAAYASFVLTGEGVYQAMGPFLPRKNVL